MSEAFDPYHVWLGIPPQEQPPNNYRLLGISLFENNPEVIRDAVMQRTAHVRTYQLGKYLDASQRILNEIARAKTCLQEPQKKADYDCKLRELLDRQAVGEDTSTELKALQELGELLAAEATRPAPKPRPKSANATLLLAVGGSIAILAAIAGWVLLRRPAPEIAQTDTTPTAASSQPSPTQSSTVTIGPAAAIPSAANRELGASASSTTQSSSAAQPATAPPIVKTEAKPSPEAAQAAAKTEPSTPVPASAQPVAPVQPMPAPPAVAVQPPPQSPASPPPAAQPIIRAKSPVPDEAALAGALKVAQDIFKTEYTQAQTPTALTTLAKKILQKAAEIQSDMPSRFVFYRLARDVAIKAGDNKTAFEAIDGLADSFEIDPWEMKASVLGNASKQVRKPAERKQFAQEILTLMNQALEHDAFAVGEKMAKLALAEGGKVRDKEITVSAREGLKQAEQAAKAYAKIEAALGTLKDNPNDAAANLIVGRYRCLAKGDWGRGLPHLAKGDDAGLKSLAEKEQAAVGDQISVAAGLDLGDGWWDLSQKAQGRDREAMLLRATDWYRRVVVDIDSEVLKIKVEKRLEEAAKQGSVAAESVAQKRRTNFASPTQKSFVNSIGMQFVLIPAGKFMMGSTPEEIVQATEDSKTWRLGKQFVPNEGPRHPVQIGNPFYLGVYEVTQAEYEQVMNMTDDAPSVNKDTARHPARMISWRDATQFCQKLSARPKENMTHRVYRLPTEAEWEYACRAGTTTKWSFGNDPTLADDYAWFAKNAQGETHPVGQKKPNAWGLYDMYGNVWEWCSDWFGKDYYRQSPASDPTGPSDGTLRVMRGGAWSVAGPGVFRSAFRDTPMPQATAHPYMGLRVVTQIGKGSKP